MSVMVFVFIHSVALVHLDKFRSLSSMKSFYFSLHYSCYIQYKLWILRYTVLSVFLLTVFAMNGMHIY